MTEFKCIDMSKRLLFTFLISTVAFFVMGKPAYAQDCSSICEGGQYLDDSIVQKCVYQTGLADVSDPGIERTGAASTFASGTFTPILLFTGQTPDELLKAACEGLPEIKQNAGVVPDHIKYAFKNSDRQGASVMGMIATVGESIESADAIPVKFAYYAQDTIERVPFVGDTALAQGTRFNYLGADFVLALWKETRRIAYAIMSLALIVTGVLIMLRKQLPSKVGVTVQYALPRIILALILITFSYPIASFGIALIPVLRNIGAGILANAGSSLDLSSKLNDYTSIFDLPLLITYMSTASLGGIAKDALGVIFGITLGASSIIMTTIVMIAWLLFSAAAFLRTVVIQIQILGSVIFAPITFAWSAIPGNEKLTVDWFKKLGAKILAVPAMYFYLSLATFVIKAAWLGNLNINTSFDTWYDVGSVVENFLIWFFVPFISMMILIQSLTIPSKIEKSFMGDKK